MNNTLKLHSVNKLIWLENFYEVFSDEFQLNLSKNRNQA